MVGFDGIRHRCRMEARYTSDPGWVAIGLLLSAWMVALFVSTCVVWLASG